MKLQDPVGIQRVCTKCGGFGMLPCPACGGSKKSGRRHSSNSIILRCTFCDQGGLVRCDQCWQRWSQKPKQLTYVMWVYKSIMTEREPGIKATIETKAVTKITVIWGTKATVWCTFNSIIHIHYVKQSITCLKDNVMDTFILAMAGENCEIL